MNSSIAFLSALVLFPLVASAETITVLGQKIDAANIEYYSGTKNISNFNVTQPVTFRLARQNTIVARDLVFLTPDGKLSVISSPDSQDVQWQNAKGTSVALDCGKRPATLAGGESARIISFYPDLEYKSGCALKQPTNIMDPQGDALLVKGDLEVSESFALIYANELVKGSIRIGPSVVALESGKEVAFYASGNPQFFTLQVGQTFTVQDPQYGTLNLGQPAGIHAATSLSENGLVDRAVLAQPIVHKETQTPIPANSGVIFSADSKSIIAVIFPQATPMKAVGYPLLATRFTYNQNGAFLVITIAQDFTFQNPNTNQPLDVPPGSEVQLSDKFEIVGILEI